MTMALREALAALDSQIARELKEVARRSPVCWRLTSLGVGPIGPQSIVGDATIVPRSPYFWSVP
jgi:hypothetical protein